MDKEFIEAVKSIADSIKQSGDATVKVTEAMAEGLEYIKAKIEECEKRDAECRAKRSSLEKPIYSGDRFKVCTDNVFVDLDDDKENDSITFVKDSEIVVKSISVDRHCDIIYTLAASDGITFAYESRHFQRLIEAGLITRL